MARTERAKPRNQKAPRNANTAAARRSQLSRSLSKLLRHQAENEKVPITAAGWVRLDDLLAWKGLDRIAKDVTLTEIFEVVEEDGRTGKGRFGLKVIGEDTDVDAVSEGTGEREGDEGLQTVRVDVDGAATGEMIEATRSLSVSNSTSTTQQQRHTATSQPLPLQLDPSSKNTAETQSVLHHHTTHLDSPASHYLIRATQGHSMKSIESVSLLTPLTLSNPSTTLPDTVVHGTFYAAWPKILATGGLKPMGRNNVHFATGPALDEVLALTDADPRAMAHRNQVDAVLARDKVVSGMRWDAQILIYVDLRRCLEDVRDKKTDMTWWISGNGVVLTEGVVVGQSTQPQPQPQPQQQDLELSQTRLSQEHADDDDDDDDNAATENSRSTSTRHTQLVEKIVPTEYWSAAVEIKNGVGVLWRRGEGVVRDLPDRLKNMPPPRGKGRIHGQRGGGGERAKRGGGRPMLNVERGGGGGGLRDEDVAGEMDDDGDEE